MNPKKKRWTVIGAGAAAGLTGGLILGSLGIAGAATSSPSSTSSSAPAASAPASGTAPSGTAPSGTAPSGTSGAQAPPSQASFPAHGTAAHEDQETAVTGAAASQAQAAAVKSVGSGTAGAVTTDFTHTGYEVTVTKSDGSQVEVHLDSSFNVMQGGHPGPSGPNGYGPPPAA